MGLFKVCFRKVKRMEIMIEVFRVLWKMMRKIGIEKILSFILGYLVVMVKVEML